MSESKKALLDLGFWILIACMGAYAIAIDIGRMNEARLQAAKADACHSQPSMPAPGNLEHAAK